jgi:hypothetical protein
MNNNHTTRRLVPFFTIQNDVVLDFKLEIFAKVQVGPSSSDFF